MKSSQLFWGFFFITFGALYLIGRYTAFIIDWYAIWDLWPVVIILVGVAIILKGTFVKPVISILFGLLLAFLAFGFFNDIFDVFEDHHNYMRNSIDISENNYNIEYDRDINHVNLNIEAGAGKFNIEKTTDALVKGFSRGNVGNYTFTNSQQDSIAWVNISMEKLNYNFLDSDLSNNFRLSLNKNPTYSFDLKIGAAKSYFNLIPFKVKNLVIQTGATNTRIKLGNKTEMLYVNIEMGAAKLKIYIPKTSGCKITGDMILMSKKLADFEQRSSDYYITSNFESASEKIIMHIEGGISSFTVKRY